MRNWLKILRKQSSLTQEELAKKLEVSRQNYTQIETGKRQADLSLSMTVRLAEIFGITIEQIAEYENKKSTEAGA